MLPNILYNSTDHIQASLFISDPWCLATTPKLLYVIKKSVGWLKTLLYRWMNECLYHLLITEANKVTST